LLLGDFGCPKKMRSAACQEAPYCCLEAYSRPAFTVPLVLRLETRPDAIQLCGHLLKDAQGVVDATRQLVERVGARGRFEVPLQELGEATPCRVFILRDLVEPNSGVSFQIARNQPYLFFRHDSLPAEVEFALVDEDHRIRGPIKLWKIHRGARTAGSKLRGGGGFPQIAGGSANPADGATCLTTARADETRRRLGGEEGGASAVVEMGRGRRDEDSRNDAVDGGGAWWVTGRRRGGWATDGDVAVGVWLRPN
jgi:hypothetical protein